MSGNRRESLSEVENADQSVTYVLYSHGRSKLVSQREWEKSWLDWWHKINKIQELE